MIGVECNRDPAGIVALCKYAGLLILKAGKNTVRFLPPLIVTKKDIDNALKIFELIIEKQ